MSLSLDALEMLTQDDMDRAEMQAFALEERGRELELPDITYRARLVQADVLGRRGETARAAVIERDALGWAVAHGDDYVMARAQRLQTTFYARIGDHAAALECAVIAVDRLGPDVPRRLIADHLMGLALAYCGVQSFDLARDRFTEVASLAQDIDNPELHVRALNNLAFMEYLAGFGERSLRIAEELAVVAESNGIELNAATMETTARAQISLGAYADAQQTLTRALSDGARITESDDIAVLQLSLAECHRLQGNVESAEECLRLALEQCDERELEAVRPLVVEEQSQLAAARGDYRSAYELYREFHRLEAEQLSAARESRSRILAAVLETDQAVSNSERYREMSLRDPLTGLYNRRYVEESLARLLFQAGPGSPLSIAIADLDHFKRINDLRSHEVGDTVLKHLAPLLENACLPSGFAARLGGEEFLLVLPGHDAQLAGWAAEAVAVSVREYDWQAIVGELPVTVSIGVATATAPTTTMSELLSEADRRLYTAKRDGRDRVVTG